MLVMGLARSKHHATGALWVELLKDPVLNGHAVEALSKAKVKVPEAREGFTLMLTDSRTWVREAAERALIRTQ